MASRNYGTITQESQAASSKQLFNFIWTTTDFQNYFKAGDQYGKSCESPDFYTDAEHQNKWSVSMYFTSPYYSFSDYLAIRASLKSGNFNENKFVVQFSIVDKDSHRNFTKTVCITNNEGLVREFVETNVLLNEQTLSNNKLKISISIFDLSKINEVPRSQRAQLEGFEKLLNNEKLSDFKIVAREKEFRVHRAILAARSPVFEAMFDSGMRETNEEKVRIDDIEPKVMEKLLHFIYTGATDLENLTDKILVAAEKYQVNSLKLLCEDVLAKGLSTDNVYGTLLLADQNNAVNLKMKAVEFFDEHLKKLVAANDFTASLNSLPTSVKSDIIHAIALKR